MTPDRLREGQISLAEVIIDCQVVRQEERYLAGVVLHSTEEVVSEHANCILVDGHAMSDALIEDFRRTELKTFKVIEEALVLARQKNSLLHRFQLDTHVVRLKVRLKDLNCF